MFKGLFSKTEPTTDNQESEEQAKARAARGYTVGWLLQSERTSVIWDAPKPFRPETPRTRLQNLWRNVRRFSTLIAAIS